MNEIQTELEHAKEGIQDKDFIIWWGIHKTAIGDRFRDRRSAFVKYIRDNVGEHLGMGKCPSEKGNPKAIRDWKIGVCNAWTMGLIIARCQRLYYPAFVTQLVLSTSSSSDPYTTYLGEYVPVDLDAGDYWRNLIILEAFACNIIAVCFSERICRQNVQCDEDNAGGEALGKAIKLVLHQRGFYGEGTPLNELHLEWMRQMGAKNK
jgi:hypothetical protein